MKRRQSAGLLLIVNVVVSLAVALGVAMLYDDFRPQEESRSRPTIVIVLSPTPDPNQPLSADQLQATVDVLSLTATAAARQMEALAAAQESSGSSGSINPPPAATATSNNRSNLPTLPPEFIPSLPASLGQSSSSTGTGENLAAPEGSPTPDDGCERYYVQSGDNAGAIAQRYGVTLSSLFVLNGINDQTILRVGDELLIPSTGCQPDTPPTATVTLRPTFNLTFVAPTVTLAPTAVDSQVAITEVLNPGDITAEQVSIQNLGGEINMAGWTLRDEQDNRYNFPELRLVPGSIIRVLTRTGTNTPGFLYWNQSSAMWELGETISLYNAAGELQSTQTVGGEIIQFDDNADE